MLENDLYGMILEIIEEETIYLRHYIGEVVDLQDSLKKGRVKITLPDLGMDSADKALWCFPRQGAGITIPKIGSWAEVYFINGDRQKPVYLFPASEIKDNTPKNYSGDVKESILFEDHNSKENNIKYSQSDKTLTIFNGEKETARKDDAVKVSIPAGTFIVSVSGGSGAPAVGVLNPAAIEVTGTITEGTDKVKMP